jgi:hypothetical protein
MTDSVTILFTFGYGQLCPYTGKELGDHYALITAPDRSSARLFMNTAFKRNWAFEYDGPGDVKIADYVPRMTLHITANLVCRRTTRTPGRVRWSWSAASRRSRCATGVPTPCTRTRLAIPTTVPRTSSRRAGTAR